MRSFILLLALASLAAASYPGQRPYEVEHYDVSLRPNVDSGTLEGTVSIRFHSLQPKLGTLTLDAVELEVESVTENGQPIEFDLDEGMLAVILSRPAMEKESRTIVVKYRGKPKRGMRFFSEHLYTAFATSHWMVCNDRPDNRATYRLELSVPAAYTVVATGTKVSEKASGGVKKSVWEEKRPLPTFVFGFAAGQFHKAEAKQGEVEMLYFSGKHSPEQLGKIFQATGAALTFFEQKSGVPLPGRAYSQVLVAGGAEQEAGSFTMLPVEYGNDVLQQKADLWLIAHELAHQWWGIAITCRDWSDFWLNEGLASFLADAFLESYSGKLAYDSQIEKAHVRYLNLLKDGKDRPLVFTDWKVPGEAGGPIPYAKGAYFVHLLRQSMGEEAFWKGLQQYTQANMGRSVETKQFQAAMEAAAGKSLSDLFDQWAYARTRASK